MAYPIFWFDNSVPNPLEMKNNCIKITTFKIIIQNLTDKQIKFCQKEYVTSLIQF